MKFGFIGPVVFEEKMFKECGRCTDRQRRPTYPIRGSGELINKMSWGTEMSNLKQCEVYKQSAGLHKVTSLCNY